MSRVTTRKRAAPGAEPMQVQQLHSTQRIPSDQFAQWSPQVMSQQGSGYTADSDIYGHQAYSNVADQNAITASSQNQLSRRSLSNQVPTRQGQSNGAWADASLAPTQQTFDFSAAVGDDLDQRAEIAKREMQSNRKQVPPFVQKLSRYVSLWSAM